MKTVEISLKEIIVYVLRRWKAIAAFALTLAVLIGAYTSIRQNTSIKDMADTAAPTATDVTATESPKSSFTLSLSIDLINFNKHYMGTSAESYHTTFVGNDFLDKLQNRYLIVAQGAPLTEILKGIVPEELSEEDLHQLVNVNSPSIGMINITVSGHDKIDLEKAAEAIYHYLLGYQDTISRSVNEHSFSVLTSANLTNTVTPQDSASQNSATDPQDSASKNSDGYVENAIVGLLVGLVVGIFATVCMYLIKLPVQTPEHIQRQLGIRYLGGIRRKKHLSCGDRLAGTLRMADDKSAMALIYANLRELAGNKKRILITGTISEQLIKEFSERIAAEYKKDDIFINYGADININAETVSLLAGSDAVVLVERIETSKLRHVNDEKDRIDMSAKEILGYVLY